ncbi:hypothetical protein DFA_04096 [Cavenderia fasciculata]|uniref:EF-hand domain-containing protein n=1 Tax=Cavenderia fasciculata TaxID=261658 RepID=F4Q1A1_CACFS|nr:uncharacterized protein DFA_04096 [Cavenderia fasciculata]EGG18602.1 hypothetical protein DFA_04096 [Cavenderia fasciculata]|eukprot:XP_004366506.1 hypothetical protein DFA_04096 [Cavenderia fasciculata]
MSTPNLTQEQIQKIRVSFTKFDSDGNGTLDKKELRLVLEDTLNRKLTDNLFSMYLELQFNASDKDFNGVIDFNEFCSLYSKIYLNPELPISMRAKPGAAPYKHLETGDNAPKVKHVTVELTEAEIEEARVVFQKYDKDNSGTIDRSELKELVKESLTRKMGDILVNRLVDSNMQLADKDGSGAIDFNEFIAIYGKLVNPVQSSPIPGAVVLPGLVPPKK